MKIAIVAFLCYTGFSEAKSVKGCTSTASCELDLNSDLPTKNDPVYFETNRNGNLVLALPDNGVIDLKKKQELVLACTGRRNSLQASGTAVTETKCASGSNLNVGGKIIASVDLNCTSRSAASLLITDVRCALNSVIIQSGFQVDSDWFPLIDSCHDIDRANTHWSSHILYGSRLEGKVINSDRPGFSRGDKRLFQGFNPDEAYSQANQREAFAEIYGQQSADKYIVKSERFYLARGHLSPDADFLFATWQMATYFFVNVAPQWQSINAGNWLGIENDARKLAINLGKDLQDITGTHGVLKLADDNGTMREAYLEGDRLPVPELLWKMLRNPEDDSCVVLVSTNNPHLTSPPSTICPDVCSQNGWEVRQDDLTKGYVYCCDYLTFKAAASQAPELTCTSVLKFI